jgi:hypothetical protein
MVLSRFARSVFAKHAAHRISMQIFLRVGSGAYLNLGISHITEIGEKAGPGWVPAQLFPGSRAGGRVISPREKPEETEMLLRLFL